jgi:hypothetical protein
LRELYLRTDSSFSGDHWPPALVLASDAGEQPIGEPPKKKGESNAQVEDELRIP